MYILETYTFTAFIAISTHDRWRLLLNDLAISIISSNACQAMNMPVFLHHEGSNAVLRFLQIVI